MKDLKELLNKLRNLKPLERITELKKLLNSTKNKDKINIIKKEIEIAEKEIKKEKLEEIIPIIPLITNNQEILIHEPTLEQVLGAIPNESPGLVYGITQLNNGEEEQHLYKSENLTTAKITGTSDYLNIQRRSEDLNSGYRTTSKTPTEIYTTKYKTKEELEEDED